jgi:hypothetical protein
MPVQAILRISKGSGTKRFQIRALTVWRPNDVAKIVEAFAAGRGGADDLGAILQSNTD